MILATILDQLLGMLCLGTFGLVGVAALAVIWGTRFLKQNASARTAAGEIAKETAVRVSSAFQGLTAARRGAIRRIPCVIHSLA